MKTDLTIIIAHFVLKDSVLKNPLLKTIEKIYNQKKKYNIEIIIADDGSNYSKNITNNYSKKIIIDDDIRDIYILEKTKLINFLNLNNIDNCLIKKWIYLPKIIKCMSKAKVTNYAVQESDSDKILFLDDDNYFISENSIENIIYLFKKYEFIVGQIKDNNGRYRKYSSSRVQGTTVGLKKQIFNNISGLGEWTEKYSCGIDSDLWIKLYNYSKNNNLKACYTGQISTYDSYSKRWGKYTDFLRNFKLKKKFYKLYGCKNYRSKYHNFSRNKKLWIKNLINE